MQTEQMMKEAAQAAESAKRSRQEFERQRDQLMLQLGMREDANLKGSLDLLFDLGHTAGSTGESSLQLKEALESYKIEFERSYKLNKERADAEAADAKAHAETMAAQIAVLTRVAEAVEKLPLDRIADALDDFMEEEEEEPEPVPQPRKHPR